MSHRHSNLFYAALVLLVLTLTGFKFSDILKGPQKEKTTESDKPYEVPAPVIDAFANLFYKVMIIGIAKIENKLIVDPEKKKLFSKVLKGLKKAASRLKSSEKAKKEDELAENPEEGDKHTEKTDKEDKPLDKDLKILAQVNKVFKKLKEAARQSEYGETAKRFKWELNVIKDDKRKNAFAWPGGKIVIYTGFLTDDDYCSNIAGLAGVLGHEMTHALAQHYAHRFKHFTKKMIDNFPFEELAVAAGGATALDPKTFKPEITIPIMVALGMGSLVDVDEHPFAQNYESDADYKGYRLAASAGFDPDEAINFLWRMHLNEENKKDTEYLGTHPQPHKRFKDMRDKYLDDLKIIYDNLNLTKKEKKYSRDPLVGISTSS